MNRYTKIINMMDSYYTKDYEKTKKNITKVREVREETVRKFFLQGDCEVLVVFEETGREILIDDFSSDEDIRKYLGPKFIDNNFIQLMYKFRFWVNNINVKLNI